MSHQKCVSLLMISSRIKLIVNHRIDKDYKKKER